MLNASLRATILFALPLFAACSSTPTPTELCEDAYAKKCADDDNGDRTAAQCAKEAQSILDAAAQRGSSCQESVDRYFECVGSKLDTIDQCTDGGEELDTCSNDDIACALQDDSDDVTSK